MSCPRHQDMPIDECDRCAVWALSHAIGAKETDVEIMIQNAVTSLVERVGPVTEVGAALLAALVHERVARVWRGRASELALEQGPDFEEGSLS